MRGTEVTFMSYEDVPVFMLGGEMRWSVFAHALCLRATKEKSRGFI